MSSKHIINCFQHISGSCGALHSPCGGAPQQRGPLTPQTQTRPNRLHTHTHPPKRLAHPRSPIPPLSTLTSRATHAHPTSPRSTGFCAIWGCISSSSSFLWLWSAAERMDPRADSLSWLAGGGRLSPPWPCVQVAGGPRSRKKCNDRPIRSAARAASCRAVIG